MVIPASFAACLFHIFPPWSMLFSDLRLVNKQTHRGIQTVETMKRAPCTEHRQPFDRGYGWRGIIPVPTTFIEPLALVTLSDSAPC